MDVFTRNYSSIVLKFGTGLKFHVANVVLKFHNIRIQHVDVIERRISKKIEKNRKTAIFMRNNFSISLNNTSGLSLEISKVPMKFQHDQSSGLAGIVRTNTQKYKKITFRIFFPV